MSGKIIGYIRVSTYEQNTDRQLENIVVDRTYIDKASGKDANRPQLKELLEFVRSDDRVVVHSIDRLARNVDDLKRIVNLLISKDVTVEFIKEQLVFSSDKSHISLLMLHIIGGIAEFERSLLKERQQEGIEIAKGKGVYKGRIPKLNVEQVVELHRRIENGQPKAKIAREMNISRTTLYEYAKVKAVA